MRINKSFVVGIAVCLLWPCLSWSAAPTLVSYQQSTWSDTGNTETTASVSWSTGDLVVVLGMTSDNAQSTLALQNATGLTFSAVSGSPTNTNSSCKGYAWSAVATSSSSGVLTATTDTNGTGRGLSVFVFSGSDGVGATSFDATLGATTTKSVTRTGNNSFVIQGWGDWNAVNDTTVTWTPGSETQRVAQFVSGNATFFVANWGDQGAAGSTSYGFSGFAGGDMTAVTIEILGTAGGGGGDPVRALPLMGVGQ